MPQAKTMFLAQYFLGWDCFSEGFPKTWAGRNTFYAGVYPSNSDSTALRAMTGQNSESAVIFQR